MLFRVFQVETTQKWFTIPFFWDHPGTMQLAQGHTAWLFSQEAQWGTKFTISGSANQIPKPLNHSASNYNRPIELILMEELTY